MSDPTSAAERLAGLSREQRALLFEQVRKRKEKERAAAPQDRVPRRPPDCGPVPASFAQERLWFLDRLEPGNPAFNMGSALRLRGRLDAGALAGALNEIVRRHEVLRTSFIEVDGRPMQRIVPRLRLSLPLIDLAALPEVVGEAEGGRITRASLAASFDLAAGPLVRASLLRLAPDLHLLLLDVHHVASDGWSTGILNQELVVLYAAGVAREPSPLPPLPIQYGDFALWQRQWLRGEILETQLAYWRGKLGGGLAPLDLPADRPRPAVQTFRGGNLQLPLPQGLGSALRNLAREGRASLFMVLLAAFQALLSRLSGQDDVIVGSPVAGRHRTETEGLIGLFLNTLALRSDLAGNPGFRELLARVRETTLGAYAHQDVPFEALLAELRPERDLSRTPVFQVLFNMLNLPSAGGRLPSLEVEAGPAPEPESKFDLTLYVIELGETVHLDLVYNSDLFDSPRMEEMLRQYRMILEGVVRDPERRIDTLSQVTPEAAAVLPDPAVPLVAEWPGAVHERFLAHARRHPERPAATDSKGIWTWGDLDAASGRLAAQLKTAGVGPGDPVAVWAHRAAPLAAALLGVLRVGGAFVVLDPAYPPARLVDVVRRARPLAWVEVPGAAPLPVDVAAGLAGIFPLRVDAPGLPVDLNAPCVAVHPEAPAWIAFTSGSTGEPKGIVGSHRPLSHFLAWHETTFGLGENDRFSLLSGLAHDPLLRDVFTPLWVGGELHVPDPERMGEPGWLAGWCDREGITVAHLTPAMIRLLAMGQEERSLTVLRLVCSGGEALTGEDVARLRRVAPKARLVNFYGATETPQAMGWKVVDETVSRVPLGRGIDGVDLLVLGRAGEPAGIGELGEIGIRTPYLALGYLDDPAGTAERFIPAVSGRLYRTGDLGRYQPDGEVIYAGRADRQVKIRGFRVEPAEVEAALDRLGEVNASAVVAREDGGDLYLVAYVVPKPGTEPGLAGRLHPLLAARLPASMMPAFFVELPILPLTPNGKLDRRALPAPQRQGSEAGGEPRGPVEEGLASLWTDLLRLDRVGAHDNFFALGGHSLLATQLISRLREAFQVELPLRALFEAPTIAGLAARIELERRAADGPPPVPPVRRVAHDRPLPLSFAQERLWFLHLLAPDSPVYNMGAAVRLSGRLDTAALAAALAEIQRRHEALRTTFRATTTGAVQEVQPWAPLPQPLIDLSALPEAARSPEARRVVGHEESRPFDLERGPLLRALLLRLGDESHVALWSTHHVAADGWSLTEVFIPELARLYAVALHRQPSPLLEPPVQYADYAVWQREWLSGTVLAEQLGYWRRQLAGLSPLELPADRPRPPVSSGRGGSRFWALPPGDVERLARLAQERDSTLFMALFSALGATLHRETGMTELPVGMPVANRSRTEIEGLIGFFVNTLVLRADLAGDPDLPSLLARSRDTVLGALSHQDIPFERLVDELALPRNPHRPPLLRVVFQLQTTRGGEGGLELPGLTLTPFAAGAEAAKFDLVVHLFEAAGQVAGAFRYDADLFDAATVARLTEHFTTLLAAWIDAPERRLGDLPLLAPAERHQLLVEWNPAAGSTEDGGSCLHRRFEAQADRAPEALAVVSRGERLGYGELDGQANRLAHHLRASGVRPGDRVALLLERSTEMIVALLAVLKAGAAYVPLDPTYPAERLAFTLADSGATLLVTSGELGIEAVRAIRLDAEREEIAGRSAERLDIPITPELPAYVIYTSGSTGTPKGVVVTHANAGRLFTATDPWFGFGADDVWTLFHSYAFDFSVWEIWGALLYGGQLVVVPYWESRSPEDFYRLLRDERVTVLSQTPSAFRQLLWAEEEVLKGDSPDLALRWVIFGGEALEPAGLAPWFARHGDERPRLVNMYGITETTVHVTWRPVRTSDLAGGSLIGEPIPDLSVHLLDSGLRPVPIGTPGEIHVGGAGLAQGYLARPELTAGRFVPDPFVSAPGARLYRSGDLARRLPNGDLEYLGRIDSQVKIRGFRIELGEIETALAGQAAVREAVVLAREDGRNGERRLVAYVVGDAADPALLRRSLAERLPEYMIPAAFVFLPSLPLTENGKIDRRNLPVPEAAAGTSRTDRVLPRTPLKRLLADQFREVLGLPSEREIGVDESFFDLGGHSLLATQLVSRVREGFRVELPLRTVFDAPTIAELADWIEQTLLLSGETPPPVVPVPRDQPLPLSFAQERLWFLHLMAPDSPVYNLGGAVRLVGRLDAAALAAALSGIVRRHEALRTTFRATRTGAVQEIQPWAPQPQPLVDLSALPAAIRHPAALRLAGEEQDRPFDLARGPLLRTLLLRLGDEDHAALWRTHHVTADAWSLTDVFVPELTRLYAAFVRRQPSPLATLPIQYADYAVWQREWLHGEVLTAQLDYWRRQLDGLAPLELPADRPRPPVPSGRGSGRSWVLPAAATERLGGLAQGAEATLFMALFSALAATLHRETGATELPVGMPVANRSRLEIEGLIGFFVNTLVLRADLTDDPDLPSLLARSRDTVLGALSHQDIPFERLVDELALPRNPHRPPLLRVVLQFQAARGGGGLELPGLTLEPFAAGAEAAKFDLVVDLTERAGGVAGAFRYDSDLFDAATVARLAEHFTTLLAAWIDGPDRRLGDLPLLAPAERHQLLVEWNPAPGGMEAGMALHRRFEAQVDLAPEAPALILGGERLSYGELDRRANQLARHLRATGVRPGDRVALLLERSTEMVVALVATLKAGAAYVPLDPASPAERLSFTLADSGATLLVTAGERSGGALRAVHLDAEREAIASLSTERLEIAVDADFPAYVIYTSGSTGQPKGVVVTHGSVDRLFKATDPWFGFGTDDVWTLFHSYAFDFSVWEIWGALVYGGRLVVVPYWATRAPEELYRLLRAERVTVLNQTPSAFRQLLWAEEEVLKGDPPDLALRWVVFGGEALEPASLAPWFARHGDERPRLVNMYGITETTVHVTWRPVRVADLAKGSLIGQPIPDLAAYLLDEGLRPVPIGTPGEIHVGGPGLALGYLDRPELSAERFVPDPFASVPGARLYRSGDLARRLVASDLEYLGRIDSQVKIRGFRVELGEIEAALAALAGVREAVVLARDGRLVAYLAGDASDPSILRRALAARLPDYMLPADFVFLEALPLTGNGKVDRRALPAPAAAGAAPGKDRMPPRTPVERALVQQFREVLGLPAEREIGIDEDFFDLGGHSLLATQLVSRVREAFQVEVPLPTVFEAPTAAGLAAWIERALRTTSGPVAPPIAPAPRDRPLPLSFAQERLWFLHLLAPESPVYNLGAAMRLAGRLDVEVLAAALSEVLRRHEALRTTFRATLSGAVQEIHPAAPLPQPRIDLSALPVGIREEEARRIASAEAARPFDLAHGPLLRALLLRLADEEHVALWRTHHVTADGWSLGEVFVPELTRLYAAGLQGLPSPLPEPPVQYADYALWQREWLRGERLEEQLGYWREELIGLVPLELPADRPRPAVPSGRGGSHFWALPAGSTEVLSRLARAGDATLFMALFAAFSAVLYREAGATGATALPVGMPVANRSRREIEGLIGFFVNTLVLRGDLTGDPDLAALLARSRGTVLGALSHQDVPFERLVDELALPRNPHRPPLLRVTFQFQTTSATGGLELPGLTLTPFGGGLEVAKFDLVLDLFEAAGGIAGSLLFDRDLFDESTMARLAGHFTNLLAAWTAEPARHLSELPLLTAAEHHQLLVEWNPVAAVGGGRSSLHRRFESQVDRAPEALAMPAVTYGELDWRANQLARHLLASGVRPGDRVALLLERSAEMVVAILAVLKTGAAYVPLDPAYPAERLAFSLEDSGATLLVTAGEQSGGDVRAVRLDAEREEIERRSGERLAIAVDPDVPAYVIYTSGSTGRPKGVVVSHANVDRLFRATESWFGFGADDVWTLFHSYAFDFSVWEIWGALLYGGRLVVVPYWETRSPEDFYRLVRDERVTVLNQTPSAFRQLLWAEEGVLKGEPPALALRWVVFGGEALEPASLAPWFARHGDERPRLVNMYGITETTVHVTWRSVRAADLAAGSLIGQPIPDLAVHLLDGFLQPVPVGAPGEIHVGGAGLAQGYLGRPDLTAERFIPDPFAGEPGARLYRSGDLARRRPDGDLEYLGRVDQQVKIRGFRIELGEIEAALAAQAGVREAVVLARDDGRDGEPRLVAYWSGEATDAAVLRRSLAERLPDYMLPAAFVFLEALPLTENGKVDRRALPTPEAGGDGMAKERVAPRTLLERFLVQQFREVLGLPNEREVGVDEDFFELGGSSITSAIFIHRLQEAVGEIVHVVTLFDHPTVSGLADYLRDQHAEAARRLDGEGGAAPPAPVVLERGVLVPLQVGSPERRPFFFVHSVGGEVMAYFKLARLIDPSLPVYGLQSPDPPLEDVREMAALYLATLREVQPRGPYRIAGWSMGGAVAFELARQLEAQGETTEILAMIDAQAPGRWTEEAEFQNAEWMMLFATALEQIYEVEIPPDLELPAVDLATLDIDTALDIALDLGRRIGLLSPNLEPAELRRLFERFRANRSSLRTYHGPYSYGGELHLFRATEGVMAQAEDPTLGWGGLLEGRVRIFYVPGDHRTIVKRGAEAMAAHLRALLAESEP
jgi:amino acid adenylation domain-containing protein